MPSDFNDGIEKLLQAIVDGYTGMIAHGIICVENPDATPETIALSGVDPCLAVDAKELISALTRPTPDRSEARERIAAEFAEKFPAVLAQYSQFKIVDWFLATGLVQDEASIRADEREKCAHIFEVRRNLSAADAAIADAIRKGGSK